MSNRRRVAARKSASCLFLTACAVTLMLGGCLDGRVRGVTVEVIEAKPFVKTIYASGRLEAFQPFFVRSPASGTLSRVLVSEGDTVQAGQPLAGFDEGELYKAARKAESNYLTQASMGDILSGLFSTINSLSGAFNSSFAVLDHYRSSLVSLTCLLGEEVRAREKGVELRLGYSVTCEVTAVEKEAALMLPLEAVRLEPSPHVFVVEGGRARKRHVTLGIEDGGQTEVVKGLVEGEQVAIGGTSRLKDGDRL